MARAVVGAGDEAQAQAKRAKDNGKAPGSKQTAGLLLIDLAAHASELETSHQPKLAEELVRKTP